MKRTITIIPFLLCAIMATAQTNDTEGKCSQKQNTNTSEQQRIFKELADNMVYVQGGTFTMGATKEQRSEAKYDEKPAHSVTLSSFYICKYEVTQELWETVMGGSISQFISEYEWEPHGIGNKYPMYYVTWNECKIFISKLDSLTGKNYRFPTEAEWEYACRGGKRSKGYKYSGSNTIGDIAWYDGNSGSETHEVGTKRPNELGIYDMSGNVGEWCSDLYGEYSSSKQTAPTGESDEPFRVFRGGSWDSYATDCRTSSRNNDDPDNRIGIGLRLCLSTK